MQYYVAVLYPVGIKMVCTTTCSYHVFISKVSIPAVARLTHTRKLFVHPFGKKVLHGSITLTTEIARSTSEFAIHVFLAEIVVGISVNEPNSVYHFITYNVGIIF